MPHILIAETLAEHAMQSFMQQKECRLYDRVPEHDDGKLYFIYQPHITVEELEQQLAHYDGLIVRPKQVTAKAILNAPKLKLIVRGGSGVNAIDATAAKEKNVVVENTPGLNSTATAEYSFALMVELLAKRNIHLAHHDTIHHKAKMPEYYAGYELSGKRIGIVGYGNIGKRMVQRCKAFEMDVVVYNRTPVTGDFQYCRTLDALFSQELDIVSLHIPLAPETMGIVNTALLALLPKPVILLNTARPQLVDVAAFKEALQQGKIVSAGIDGDEDVIAPFIKADTTQQCLITPHIADSTVEAQEAIARQVLEQVYAFFMNQKKINRVI